ncbi:MAG: hypothetical protein WD402_09470 [Chloroflexota bacterium]
MTSLRNALSPWAIGGLVLWLLVLAFALAWTIPVFANVSSGPACTPTPCAVRTTTEWLPSLVVAALVATLVVAGGWGLLTSIRRSR